MDVNQLIKVNEILYEYTKEGNIKRKYFHDGLITSQKQLRLLQK